MPSHVTNFDFSEHPLAVWENGHAERMGDLWFQNDYSVTSQTIQIRDGVLSFESSVDDEAIIMAVDSNEFAERAYFLRAVLKVPEWDDFMYAGILAHADVGGTAHPETEGVVLGLMHTEDGWFLRCKQWTDGDIYGYLQKPVPIPGFSTERWYTLQLQVSPRGDFDTEFSGRLWEISDQERPTVAHTGNLVGEFDDLWDPMTGQWDNSDPPQWNPRLHNVGLFQWYGCPIRYRSFGIASKETDFQRPLIYTRDPVAPAGEAISFRSSPMTEADSLTWDFGDGTSADEQHPYKTYENPGEYTIRLSSVRSGSGAVSNPVRITVLPHESPGECFDDFATGTDGWRYEAKGLNGTPDDECDPVYIRGAHDPNVAGGSLMLEAFNHSPGSPAQEGGDYCLDNWDLRTVSAQWYKPIYLESASRITIIYAVQLTSQNLSDTDGFALLVTDNDRSVSGVHLVGTQSTSATEETVSVDAESGIHRIGLGLWCDTLSTKPVLLDEDTDEDGPSDDTPRRCNLLTHRMDHWDDNGRVTAWLTRVHISIGATT